MFAPNQVELLRATLDRERVAHRKKQGQTLSYLEGFDVIEAANAIFGFDGWSYVVTRLEQVGTVWYATVRVTVNAGGDPVEREDVGVGLPAAKAGEVPTPDAVETAIKASLTDGLKRALRTFGDQFGNGLYDKDAPEHGTDGGPPADAAHDGDEQQPARPTISRTHDGETRACPTCQKPMLWKEGVSKANKPYSGWFCSDRGCAQTPLFAAAKPAPTPLRVAPQEPAPKAERLLTAQEQTELASTVLNIGQSQGYAAADIFGWLKGYITGVLGKRTRGEMTPSEAAALIEAAGSADMAPAPHADSEGEEA